MEPLKNFTAIDFETFTAERSSACAIGLAKVKDGHIVHKFYSLINPIPDTREHNNSAVNGITKEMVDAAPTFKDLWPIISNIIGNDILVAHNSEFDQSVWHELQTFYKCSGPDLHRFFCTYKMTELSLEDACAKFGINMGCHHDALDDAVACAGVMLAAQGAIRASTFKGGLSTVMKQMGAKKYDRATLDALDDSEVQNQGTPFFHARTVITGTFTAYPNRNDLGKLLQSLGADINTSISKKTDIVVMGSGAGPAKVKKIEDLRAQGFDIRVMYEPELISILS